MRMREWAGEAGGLGTMALGGYLALYLSWLAFGWGGDEYRTLIADLAYLPMAFSIVWLA